MSRRPKPMPTREPVFLEQQPVINHPPHAWHHQVPYPYQFKIDGGWLFVLFLAAGGFAFKPLFLLAGFIALLRVMVWCRSGVFRAMAALSLSRAVAALPKPATANVGSNGRESKRRKKQRAD